MRRKETARESVYVNRDLYLNRKVRIQYLLYLFTRKSVLKRNYSESINKYQEITAVSKIILVCI